ncbi:MAG: TspO/MBR family protein [Beijerinckiaceae bacterium]
MNQRIALGVFIAVPLAAGMVIGYATAPGAWYAALVKPGFNPPNWVFAPVWSTLYVLIGVAGWLVWRRAAASPAMAFWGLQMLLNWAWSPVFFTLHAPGAALVIILLLLISILAFLFFARRVDRLAAWLFLPYAVWVAFATALNFEIWRLN